MNYIDGTNLDPALEELKLAGLRDPESATLHASLTELRSQRQRLGPEAELGSPPGVAVEPGHLPFAEFKRGVGSQY